MSEVKEKFNIKNSLGYLFYKNPVLVLGLIVGQLAAGDTNLQNGVALSICCFFIIVPVFVFAATIGKKIPKWTHPVVHSLFSMVMLAPAFAIISKFSPTIFDSLGIYPALIVVSSIPIIFTSKAVENKKVGEAFFDGIFIALGFSLTAVLLGGAREIFGYGSLWGIRILEKGSFPSAGLPFWGFILLGFMAAIVNLIKDLIDKKKEGEV